MASIALDYGRWTQASMSIDERLARLTKGQVDCLALVYEHLSSKEIAVRLDISPHTVDQRIRQALHTLGVERRSEAARLAAKAGLFKDAYQRLIHQAPHIDEAALPPHSDEAVSYQIRHADRAGGIGFVGVQTEQAPPVRWSSLPLPIATRERPANDLSVGKRLLWIVLIAMGSMFCAGMYLAGLESLSRLLAN